MKHAPELPIVDYGCRLMLNVCGRFIRDPIGSWSVRVSHQLRQVVSQQLEHTFQYETQPTSDDGAEMGEPAQSIYNLGPVRF